MKNENILARNLRKNSTDTEKRMWSILRNKNFHNLKFKRQEPIKNYIVDFVCYEKNLIVEIDGGQHNMPQNLIEDTLRTEELNKLGYTVVRFWNNDICNNINGVILELEKYI